LQQVGFVKVSRILIAIPPLLARITLASAFIASGRGKFKDLNGTAGFFKQLGIPASTVLAPFVAANEVLAGSLVGLGLFTRFAAVPLAAVLSVATGTARRKEVHSVTDLTQLMEFGYLLLLLELMANGGGEISVDRLIQQRVRRAARELEEKAPDLEAMKLTEAA